VATLPCGQNLWLFDLWYESSGRILWINPSVFDIKAPTLTVSPSWVGDSMHYYTEVSSTNWRCRQDTNISSETGKCDFKSTFGHCLTRICDWRYPKIICEAKRLRFVLVNEHLGLLTPGDHPGTLSWLVPSVCAARDVCAVQAYTEMFKKTLMRAAVKWNFCVKSK